MFSIFLFVFTLLISYGIGAGEPLDKEGKMNAQILWRYMTIENPYQNYPTWPGKEGFYESTMPPGNILKLYVNDIALDTIVNKKVYSRKVRSSSKKTTPMIKNCS